MNQDKKSIEKAFQKIREALDKHLFDEALYLTQDALSKSIEINDPNRIAYSRKLYGRVNSALSNYDLALESFFKSLNYYREAKVDKQLISINRLIGNIFFYLGSIDKAYEFFQLAYSSSEKPEFANKRAHILNNLAIINIKRKDYTKAREMLYFCKEYYYNSGDIRSYATSILNLGEVSFWQQRYDDAIEFYQESLAYCKLIRWKDGLVHAESGIGQVFMKLNQWNKALRAQFRALKMARDIQLTQHFEFIFQMISEIYKELGDAKNCYIYQKKYFAEIKKTHNNKKQYKILEIETRYKIQIKDNERKFLEDESDSLNNTLEKTQEMLNNLKRAQEQLIDEKQKNTAYALAMKTTERINSSVNKIKNAELKLSEIIPPEMERAKNHLSKINTSVKRINKLLYHFKNLENLEFTEYSSETKMLKLNKDS